jgi:hypothetical protein
LACWSSKNTSRTTTKGQENTYGTPVHLSFYNPVVQQNSGGFDNASSATSILSSTGMTATNSNNTTSNDSNPGISEPIKTSKPSANKDYNSGVSESSERVTSATGLRRSKRQRHLQ